MARHVQTSGVGPSAATPAKKQPVVLAQGDAAAIAERFKDFANIDVLTRRFNDPSEPGSLPILLNDEPANACVNSEHMHQLRPGATKCHLCKKPARKWYVRWFNLGMEGRNAQMRTKGYLGVEVKELHDKGDVADLYRGNEDTFVRRGDRGLEILGKMPLEAYNFIKARQRVAWNANMKSKKKMRADLAESAGRELGDEAGQALHDGDIQIESMREIRTTLGDEGDGADAAD